MFFTKPEKLNLPEPPRHRVFGTPLDADLPGAKVAFFGLGCLWGTGVSCALPPQM